MGLGVNYLSNIVIQLTSSLTMKVLGTLRNIFTIFLGVLFYSEAITINELIGYSIALLGFISYNMSKVGRSLKSLLIHLLTYAITIY